MNSLAQPATGSQPSNERIANAIGNPVFTQEFLHSECVRLDIPANRPNYRRMRRAWDIFQNREIEKNDEGFFVASQTCDEVYLVSPDFTCTCPDSAQKQNFCKHAIAVQLEIEHRADYDAWLDELMPHETERFESAWQ